MSSAQDTFRGVRDDAKDRLASDLNELKANFDQLKRDVSHIVGSAISASKSSARGSVESARSEANAAVERARQQYEDLRDKGTDQFEHLGQLIGERPVTSALVAFGVGFLLAKIFIRR